MIRPIKTPPRPANMCGVCKRTLGPYHAHTSCPAAVAIALAIRAFANTEVQ